MIECNCIRILLENKFVPLWSVNPNLQTKERKKKEHTEELCKNSSEEMQIPGDVVSHGRWKRFHNRVNAKYSLKKLHHKILRTSNLLETISYFNTKIFSRLFTSQ